MATSSSSFAVLLVAKMAERNLTIPDVSTATGAKQTAIYAWRAGEYLPRRAKLVALAEVLGCEIGELRAAWSDVEVTPTSEAV